MLTSTLQTALSVDPGTVVGAAVRVAAPGQTIGEDFAVTLDQTVMGTEALQGAEQEVELDGTNASTTLLDLVLAQLPQLATIPLPTTTLRVGGEPLAMIDLGQVKSNLETVSQVVESLGIPSTKSLASFDQATAHPVSKGLSAPVSAAVSPDIEPTDVGVSNVVIEGAVGAIDNYALDDSAGSRPRNGEFAGSKFQLDLNANQAAKLAELVISGMNTSDVAAKAKDILISSGADKWSEVKPSDASLIQSQISELLNQASSSTSGIAERAMNQGPAESEIVEDILVSTIDRTPIKERLIHDHRDGTQLLRRGEALENTSSIKSEFIILDSEMNLGTRGQEQPRISMKEILESVKAQIVSGQSAQAGKSSSPTSIYGEVLSIGNHRDVLLSRGSKAVMNADLEVVDSSLTKIEKASPLMALKPEVQKDTKGENGDPDSTLDFEVAKQNVEVATIGTESIKGTRAPQESQTTESIELRTAGLEKVAREVGELISARNPGRLTVRLNPENLGTIDVSIKQVGRQLDVDVMASDDRVNHALRTGRAEMVHALESKGMQVSTVNINREASGFDLSHHQGQQQAADRRDFERVVNTQSSWQPATPTTAPVPVSNTASGVDLQV